MSAKIEKIRTKIWEEEPEPDNPFAAATCRCSGYDVYGDLLAKASWFEYVYLLFCRERPSAAQAKLLERLAVALANPGLRDPSVRAAMNGAVGGTASAGCLMAALGVGAGQLGGARDVRLAMELWAACGQDTAAWAVRLESRPEERQARGFRPIEHPPGFDPHGASCPTPVRRTLAHLASSSPGARLGWLHDNRGLLEASAGCPLAMSGVAAAAFCDLGLGPEQGEMLYMVLRLPGAAAHALEQREHGWRRYPFFGDAVKLANDPGPPEKAPAGEMGGKA